MQTVHNIGVEMIWLLQEKKDHQKGENGERIEGVRKNSLNEILVESIVYMGVNF